MNEKIKKYFLILIIIIIFLIIVVNKNHKIIYKIKDKDISFQVTEEYIKKYKTSKNIYHVIIENQKTKFSYQLQHKFKYKKKIIKQIKYYKDKDYKCIIPIFENNKILTDIVCKKENKYYNYSDLIGENKFLDNYVKKIKQYKKNKFKDIKKKQVEKQNVVVYKNISLIRKPIIVDNYKGIFIIDNNQIKTINLFKKDIYKTRNKTLNGKYYLIADYNKKYEFHEIYRIDIDSGKINKITSNTPISFNSYIQGNKNGITYLLDKSNKIQYQINPKESKISSKSNNLEVFDLNKWKEMNIYQASKKEIYFNYYTTKNTSYIKIDQVGDKKYGYYYYYQKKNDNYYVYRSSQINKSDKKYLFQINDTNRIVYINDQVYYIDDNKLKMYSDLTGIKTILQNNEFRFNENLKFYIPEMR